MSAPQQVKSSVGASPDAMDKVTRLVDFLTRVAHLRSKVNRDVANYEAVVWLSSVPHDKNCFTQAWGRSEDQGLGSWLEVETYEEPRLPAIPSVCRAWVDPKALGETSTQPQLCTETVLKIPNPASADHSDEPKSIWKRAILSEHPDVEVAWARFLETAWHPWAQRHDAWQKLHDLYSAIFAIHQKQIRLGEEYELVLGLGLLSWLTPANQRICRHLVAADAQLEFDSERGKFIVSPRADGPQLRIELDMLDAQFQPAGAEKAALDGLAPAADDPWDKAHVEPVLRSLVHSIDPSGEYLDAIESKATVTAKPIVEFAPALILRKRSNRGLTEALNTIKNLVVSGGEIPHGFADLAEVLPPDQPGLERAEASLRHQFDEEIYFPLPSNAEQKRIVNELKHSRGVLVQGPPGTGKSHTIANLICHLLATGQRVLVTAKTPRALQILEHKLPPSIRPLCISLLGKASQDRNSLEQSVGGILRENQEWDESRAGLEMSLLEQQLQALRSRQSELQRMLRDIRESETHTQTIASGGYTGTAAHIAKQVNNDRSVYEWFKDETTPEAKLPVTSEILHQVLSALRHFTQEKRKELSLHRADWTLDSSGFALLVSAEKEALEEERKIWPDAHEQVAEALLQREAKEVVELEQLIADFAACRRSLSTSPYRWMSEAIKDVLASNGTVWQALRYATANCVETFTPIAATVEETTIDAPPDLRPEDLQKGAERVSAHLASGGKLGWGPFRPKAVKHLSHVIKGTKVNGNPCRSAADFATLAHALKVRVGVERTWQLWLGRCEPIRGPLPLQIASLSALREALDKVLPMGTKLSFCREKLRLFPSLLEPDWDDPTSLDKLVASCRLAMVRRRRIAVQSELKANASSAELAASDPRAHPLNKRLLEAISCREVDTYRAVHTEFAALAKEESGQLWLDGWMRYLHAELPFLAKSLDATAREPFWTERINGLDKAWKWAQAKRWVEEYIISQDVASLDQSIKRIEGEILETMERLAARRAWSHCFERMKEPHRRHMEQWRLSMVDVGQGTGPQASNYLKDARVSLDLCREAVPAWVMPLHRVWDTMKPSANMFDVVIVDEASQCGSEGLPLLFLAAKTLVVGDDKQISPEHVGIQPNEVRQLIAHFLPDFVLKSSFNIKRSLFDQAKIRYGTSRIVLREHFRCMPEIIRFSNDLCYSNTPLIPLRQYGSSRLPPTTHFFVGGGYREGEGNRVFNRPEAEAIVNKIAEMCADSRYDGKSVGVVVLQGEAQGMLIEKLLLDRIGAAEIEKRRLVCGNPYTFQGDERHIVLLSMVAAPNARMRPFSSTADERRFNVAASRAQDMMILFHSVQVEDLSRSCLRRRLLEFFQGTQQPAVAGLTRDELEFRAAKDNRAIVDPPKPFDSWFEVDVSLELLRRNYIVRAQHAVADKFINLVVEGGKARLAVECDGDHWHGPDRYEADMERQRRLERCGWAFFRVRESAFYTNTEEALRGLWDALELHGIRPVSSWQPKEAEFQEESREAVAADSSEIFEPAPGA